MDPAKDLGEGDSAKLQEEVRRVVTELFPLLEELADDPAS